MKKTAIITISGRVQGVLFRDNACKQAHGLNLSGWVRNCANGTVEIHTEGEEHLLRELINWCRKGTALASVSKVDVKWKPFEGRFYDFRIRWK